MVKGHRLADVNAGALPLLILGSCSLLGLVVHGLGCQPGFVQ
jgi:hypothetical protein